MGIAPIDPEIAAGQRLLVVDDDEDVAGLLVELVRELGLEAVGATSIPRAIELLTEQAPTIVLTDLVMPDGGGAALLAAVKTRNPTTPVLVMSVINSVEQAVELLKSGADDYLTKPLDFSLLRDRLAAVAEDVARARDLAELEELVQSAFRPAVGLIWGTSAGMLRVAAQLPRIARTNAAVLVHGESGTGKEHHRSHRRAEDPHAPASAYRAAAGRPRTARPCARLRLRRRGPGRPACLQRRRIPQPASCTPRSRTSVTGCRSASITVASPDHGLATCRGRRPGLPASRHRHRNSRPGALSSPPDHPLHTFGAAQRGRRYLAHTRICRFIFPIGSKKRIPA